MAKTRVLIVDDESEYTDVLRDRLEFEGYEVESALDGLTGLEMIRANKPRCGSFRYYDSRSGWV